MLPELLRYRISQSRETLRYSYANEVYVISCDIDIIYYRLCRDLFVTPLMSHSINPQYGFRL